MIKNYKLEDIEKNEIINDMQKTTRENKDLYGEVFTPFNLINKILNLIPEKVFENPSLKWLDPGAGSGNFSIILYFKLFESLSEKIPEIEERKKHIIKNMIYMIELRSENVENLKKNFGKDANIYEGDFLSYKHNSKINSNTPEIFDIIIGNPPFNCNGQKKVPTNNIDNKKCDGSTIWSAFVIKSMGFLKNKTGILCILIPSIWLKPDKERIYDFLTQYDIKKLNCLTNTETNRIFKGNAQTPSCYFLLTKQKTDNIITIFDKDRDEYIDYSFKFGAPIPVFGQNIINKLQKYCIDSTNNANNISNTINVIKTNMPPKNTILSTTKTEECKYPNIKTCILQKNIITQQGKIPELVINYSNKQLAFSQQTKLVLAHKMYGIPYLDISGEYGISNRDNYVIQKEKLTDLIKLQKFLSTKTAIYLFKSTRYRMMYLEKYAFELIPDITNLLNFPEEINDDTIADYFGFDEKDRENILRGYPLNSPNNTFFY
jgi:hypothetical protein